MSALGAAAERDGTCYFTGGATAVLLGWREATIDIDIALDPEQDAALRALPSIKDELGVNVELASPGDFIPSTSTCTHRRSRSSSAGTPETSRTSAR